MARLEASDAVTIDGTRSLFKGYMSLGLLSEAASLLERRVRLGAFPAEEAPPLFDGAVSAQGHFDEPERLVAVCETAIRSGIRTPLILYSYGTGLRGIRGRLGDASAILAQVESDDPYRLLALYSLGQIAAERGEAGTALDLFRRVEEGGGGVEQGGFLAARAARSRAELLLSAGKSLDAAPVFEALLRKENNPLDRIGLAATGDNSVHALEHLPAEMIAGRPLEDRVRFLLLLGGVARNSGRHETAIDRLTREATDRPAFRRAVAAAAVRSGRLRAWAAAKERCRPTPRAVGAARHRLRSSILREVWKNTGRSSSACISDTIGEG